MKAMDPLKVYEFGLRGIPKDGVFILTSLKTLNPTFIHGIRVIETQVIVDKKGV
jgi:hypothetical protein